MLEKPLENSAAVLESGRLAALADLCELLSLGFAFPTPKLALAFEDGSFWADVLACLDELEVLERRNALKQQGGQEGRQMSCQTSRQTDRQTSCQTSRQTSRQTGAAPSCRLLPSILHQPSAPFSELRREYSRLYLVPSDPEHIYVYESAFVFALRGNAGTPTLFANPLTLAVERLMTQAGALPSTANTEPADSVYAELDFLRELFTRAYAAQAHQVEGAHQVEDAHQVEGAGQAAEQDALANQAAEQGVLARQAAAGWYSQACQLCTEHIHAWLPAFFEATAAATRLDVYRQLAELGLLLCKLLPGGGSAGESNAWLTSQRAGRQANDRQAGIQESRQPNG